VGIGGGGSGEGTREEEGLRQDDGAMFEVGTSG